MKSQITETRTQRMLFKDAFCSVDCANIVNRMQTARFLATSHPYCYLVLSWWNFSDGLMLEFLCRFGSATWNEGEQGRPLVRQTENVFLRFFRFMNFAPAGAETSRLTNQNWCASWGWELVKAWEGEMWAGDGCRWCRKFFMALKPGSDWVLLPKRKFIHGRSFFHLQPTPAVRNFKHTRLRSALPFAGCSTSPKAWQNKTPDRIIEWTENYPNFLEAEASLPTSLQLKSLRFFLSPAPNGFNISC